MRGSRNFRQGGGGPGQSVKKSSDNVFVFFNPQLISQKSNGQFQRNLSFWGSNCLFPMGLYNLLFSRGWGGSGPPVPPLDPHLQISV